MRPEYQDSNEILESLAQRVFVVLTQKKKGETIRDNTIHTEAQRVFDKHPEKKRIDFKKLTLRIKEKVYQSTLPQTEKSNDDEL